MSTSTETARAGARRTAAYVAATLLLILGSVTAAAAQAGAAGAGAPPAAGLDVAVTVSDHEGPPLILRRRSDEPRNVVLVNPSTTDAQGLSDAIRALLLLEAADPAGTRRSDRAAASPAFKTPAPRYPWAAALLERLRRGAQGVGTRAGGPWHESVRLPIPRLVRP